MSIRARLMTHTSTEYAEQPEVENVCKSDYVLFKLVLQFSSSVFDQRIRSMLLIIGCFA